MKTTNAVKTIKSALRDNLECHLGVMARTRVAFAEKGVNSYRQDKELLVLISDTGWWYGHILRIDPESLEQKDHGEWMAVLVNSRCRVDGSTPEDVFKSIIFNWYDCQRYDEYFLQEPEDGFAQRHSFEEALRALCTIIERFKYNLRDCHELDPEGNFIRPEGNADIPCVDIYGRHALSDEEMYEKYERPVIEEVRKKAGLPPLDEVYSYGCVKTSHTVVSS